MGGTCGEPNGRSAESVTGQSKPPGHPNLLACAGPGSCSTQSRAAHALMPWYLCRAPAWGVCGSAAGALQNLSREIASRQVIRELGAVPALARLLACPDAQVCCWQQPAGCML